MQQRFFREIFVRMSYLILLIHFRHGNLIDTFFISNISFLFKACEGLSWFLMLRHKSNLEISARLTLVLRGRLESFKTNTLSNSAMYFSSWVPESSWKFFMIRHMVYQNILFIVFFFFPHHLIFSTSQSYCISSWTTVLMCAAVMMCTYGLFYCTSHGNYHYTVFPYYLDLMFWVYSITITSLTWIRKGRRLFSPLLIFLYEVWDNCSHCKHIAWGAVHPHLVTSYYVAFFQCPESPVFYSGLW